MITERDPLDLRRIAAGGGNLEVDGTAYDTLALRQIAHDLKDGAKLRIGNSDHLEVLAMRQIAAQSPGNVTFF